ncbi:conserved hypothetical protein, membrane [Candidatus Omnitrophus magneticus]|uniref:DUF3307 domain-containing protein n=1 Tax=Candidatus Omnitrophus magneticus TaxID=1609969 RepID=A0A0F0CTZ2_9BACT|nr:conserved hypothetical protein, membrane [Candidatus Omnitrophus magneticus]
MIPDLNILDYPLLVRLITAHFISDFIFQSDICVKDRLKKKWFSKGLYGHGIIYSAFIYIFAGCWKVFWVPLAVFLSHIMIDGNKAKCRDNLKYFFLDQIAHLFVILILWIILARVSTESFMKIFGGLFNNTFLWVYFISYIFVIWPAGVLMSKIISPWQEEIKTKEFYGLTKAGLWIGRLERVLIISFVFLGHFDAIGFLIAAKSIIRFGETRSPLAKREAEFFLIGTMLSFAIAVTTATAARYIVTRNLF